mmetsp:Transcript_42392/g.79044  ORF Transcript_42392/g.79044 Transcript_42392/m.79044 type:complete len:270 (-) Transcript_42392:70-879(-)
MPWSWHKFQHANEGLSDYDVQGLPLEEHDYEEVDLSRNFFGPVGLRSIVSFVNVQWQLKVLKLYKCGLQDDAAEMLGEFCLEYRQLQELHLSHNQITGRGAVALVTACERSRSLDQVPLWLRLEHNIIAGAAEVLHDLESQHSVCAFHAKWCTVRHCSRRRKLHLPHFANQNCPHSDNDTQYWEASAKHADEYDPADDRVSDQSDVECRGRGLRAWQREPQNRKSRSRSPVGVKVKVLDPHQLLAWQEKLLRRERELDEIERLALDLWR